MPFTIGEVINDRYRIVKLLGKGGFGAVYKAWDINLSHPCALKENLASTTEAQKQFFREASVLANLSHPHLPRVTDHFSIPDVGQYLVMDFIEGEDLQTKVERDGAVEVQQALTWIGQVLDALVYLHSRMPPVIHRDIKPANIRITPEGNAVLVDFGLVKLYDAGMKTTQGARAITPGYSPPEQYGQGQTDPRTDIYALGATLYMLLTGQHPPESVQRVAGEIIKPANQINPQVLPAVADTITRAMALTPQHRFQTAAEFRAALLAAPTSRQQPVVEVTSTDATKPAYRGVRAVAAAEPISSGPYPATIKKSRTGLTLGIIGGVVGLGLIVLCIVLAFVPSLLNPVDKTATMQAMGTEMASTAIKQTSVARTATAERSTQLTATARAANVTIFGPRSGDLVHDASDSLITVLDTGLSVRDFIAEVTFVNPYSSSFNDWDYGLLFRDEGSNMQYRLIITSSTDWYLYNNTGSADGDLIDSGTIGNLDTGSTGSNFVQLVVKGTTGEFSVNGQFVSNLDLSVRMVTGDIYLGTGMFAGDEVDGYVTAYENFVVYPAP